VEGDLGLRVSAGALWDSERADLTSRIKASGGSLDRFEEYILEIVRRPEYRPANGEEENNDEMMAAACVRSSALRHAGTMSKVYTPQGGFQVQRGKDLRRVNRLVGTGGFLSRNGSAELLREACGPMNIEAEARPLLPEHPEFYLDEDYLFPLLANLAEDFPEAAARTAVGRLRKTVESGKRKNR
jgi:uncharacterized protein (TIGR01319 family)